MSTYSANLEGVPTRRALMGRVGPLAVFALVWKRRDLIYRLARREVESRYRGSLLGVLWSFLVPLLMLGVYTFVFNGIFGSKWEGTSAPYFIILFSGLMLMNMFSDCVGRSPGLMLGNVAYIKRVVFPLEILPLVILGASLFDLLVSVIILFAVYIPVVGMPPPTALLLPLVAAPLCLLILGFSWFLSALGVYLRDSRQIIGVFLTAVPFLAPLFFPPSAFDKIKWVSRAVRFNPMTIPLIDVRQILFMHQFPDWRLWAIYTIAAWLIAYAGLACFRYMQRGFADVV